MSAAREKELLAAAVEAKEELGVAQEAAAAAASHAAHFKAIAEKNEECLKDMEAAHKVSRTSVQGNPRMMPRRSDAVAMRWIGTTRRRPL